MQLSIIMKTGNVKLFQTIFIICNYSFISYLSTPLSSSLSSVLFLIFVNFSVHWQRKFVISFFPTPPSQIILFWHYFSCFPYILISCRNIGLSFEKIFIDFLCLIFFHLLPFLSFCECFYSIFFFYLIHFVGFSMILILF